MAPGKSKRISRALNFQSLSAENNNIDSSKVTNMRRVLRQNSKLGKLVHILSRATWSRQRLAKESYVI